MRVLSTNLREVLLIEPRIHRDLRGFFLETYRLDTFGALGIHGSFVQDNHSRSVRNTVRGLHLQVARPQAKLVRVVAGEVFDVAVDVRRGSPTFGQWVGVVLSADSLKQLYIPAGFAHGFSVLSDVADLEYKCTDVYDPVSEVGIAWDDPALAIDWRVEHPILSEKDRAHPRLAALTDRLPAYCGTDL